MHFAIFSFHAVADRLDALAVDGCIKRVEEVEPVVGVELGCEGRCVALDELELVIKSELFDVVNQHTIYAGLELYPPPPRTKV